MPTSQMAQKQADLEHQRQVHSDQMAHDQTVHEATMGLEKDRLRQDGEIAKKQAAAKAAQKPKPTPKK